MKSLKEWIVLTRREDKGNLQDEDILHQIYKNPSCFENESNQNIRVKAKELKALEEYFQREKVSERTVENEGTIQSESRSENCNLVLYTVHKTYKSCPQGSG